MPSPRVIPSLDRLLDRPALAAAAEAHGRDRVAGAARQAADALRDRLRRGEAGLPDTEADALLWIEGETLRDLEGRLAGSLRRAINATGVIVHTNLGRAPLSREALARAVSIGAGYANLEYDLDAGGRGHRHVHAERLLVELTGGEAALVVNNNAAATLVVLAALAAGREAIVSRGELVEIGGGFRVPDVLAQSGAVLREVGTTNRTRVADYAAALGDRTGLILRVHPSNFSVTGFTERPTTADLAALARQFAVPLFEDLGSGWLGAAAGTPPALAGEPTVRATLAAGADLVSFSGDKLLGGPQAGIVVGRADLVDRVRRHPLMRALRADKLTYGALEATLDLWTRRPAHTAIPVYRMLTLPIDALDRRAAAILSRLRDVAGLTCRVVDGFSTIGGGAAPGSAIATRLLALDATGLSAAALEARLRAGHPPVIARIEHDTVLLDLRTIGEEEDGDLVKVLMAQCVNR
jgi:L-seryl-tRNA(Ser) seleniumtransferase